MELVARRPCRELVAVAGDRACHVVGGAVRDALLGRPHRDLDLLVAGGGERIARELAARLRGRLVDLGGAAFGSWRIVRAAGDVDLWDHAGVPLRQELARRDLTVNALAVELPAGELRDPLRGLADLRAGTLRCPRPENLRADPLRVLRLVRLTGELAGFAPTPETVVAAREAAAEIERVAGERVREEWLRIQRTTDPAAMLALLCDVELYPRLWATSGDPADALDPAESRAVIREAKHTVAGLGAAAAELSGALPPSLPAPARGVALDVLLLAALPRPLPAAARLARRKARSRAEGKRLRHLLSWPRPPGSEAACRRFLHQLGADAATGLLWLGARTLTARRHRPWWSAVSRIAELEAGSGGIIRSPPTLFTGDVLHEITGLSGRTLGRALDALREAQVLGTVRTRDEALSLIQRLLALGVWRAVEPANRVSVGRGGREHGD